MGNLSYEELLDALDLHHNVLHAEKQAIDARDLDTVEDLLSQKDESLNMILSAKSKLSENYPENVKSRINSVLTLQKSNTQNFRKLHIQDHNKSDTIGSSNPLFKRLKRAYS